MTDLFISYAHSDKKTVEAMAKELQALGYDVWIDTRGLKGGSLWLQEIEKGIIRCDVFVLFVSSGSLRSRYVRQEIKIASKNNKRIIPVRLEKIDIPRSLKPTLSPLQWIDYGDNNWKSKLLVAIGDQEHMDTEQERRFEGAMPKDAQVNQEIELRGMVSLLNSEGLRTYLPENAELITDITKQDVEGNHVPLNFPQDTSTGKLLDLNLFASVNAPDFDIEPKFRKIVIPPSMDSGVFAFRLTPLNTNERAIVMLELFQDEIMNTLIGSLSLTTKVSPVQREVIKVVWNWASLSFGVAVAHRVDLSALTKYLKAETTSLPTIDFLKDMSNQIHILRNELIQLNDLIHVSGGSIFIDITIYPVRSERELIIHRIQEIIYKMNRLSDKFADIERNPFLHDLINNFQMNELSNEFADIEKESTLQHLRAPYEYKFRLETEKYINELILIQQFLMSLTRDEGRGLSEKLRIETWRSMSGFESAREKYLDTLSYGQKLLHSLRQLGKSYPIKEADV